MATTGKRTETLEQAVIRFAGDSGDGMQLVGTQFTTASAVVGNDVSTFPDYPAEIRAPAGTLGGVSGFQINFGSRAVYTPGDIVDALVAMNPAALKVCLKDLTPGGVLVVNSDEFTPMNLAKARYETNPLETDELDKYRVYKVPITSQTLLAVKETGLNQKAAERCKNFYALGLVYWLFDRPLDVTIRWIDSKFAKVPAVAEANRRALQAGYNYGETAEIFSVRYRVGKAPLKPGRYRNVTGNQAAALGFVAAAKLAGKPLFYGSYPITPASEILHELTIYKNFDVRTFQAEDEIAAYAAVLGAAYAGCIAVTGTSGPGLALKQEGIGLGIMTELPTVIVDVQRGGPSTGLPTKTEQSDLWQAMLGRNGDCPAPVLAASSPADCFWAAMEAVRIAVKYMTPVFLLSDGYLSQGSEPWRIPNLDELAPIKVEHPTDPADFAPYRRDANGSRPWAIPGTPGLQHRVGGLEKLDVAGTVSYDPANHQRMTELRAGKVENIAAEIPPQEVYGDEAGGALLLVSWGGSFGAVRSAVERAREDGQDVSHVHLRWLNPMPRNLGEILSRFRTVVVCEMNMGQLQMLLRARYLVDAYGLHKVRGRPFMVSDIRAKIDEVLGGR
ncbi:MAG TPA: 2-oxoacid:acceptor oxidoreductase subunit alpha [Phycisphaerae bacterium]|mgnify:FL=1|nr:2-oxoacid:acceptor oxidoreductase subunit alpha [Phycisphaerae bacterium]